MRGLCGEGASGSLHLSGNIGESHIGLNSGLSLLLTAANNSDQRLDLRDT